MLGVELRKYTSFSLLSFWLVACGDQSSQSTDEDFIKSDLVEYEVSFELKEDASLPREQLAIYESIQKNEPVAFSALTEIFIQKHLISYNQAQKNKSDAEWTADQSAADAETVQREIDQLLENLPTDNLHQMKIEYESRLGRSGEIFYEATSTSLVDFVLRNRMQSYSGTSLHQVLLRESLGAEEFRNRNIVVIYEEAHMLPGYMTERGGDWYLTGIETTTSGPSEVEYGKVQEIDTQIRVVDADLFVIAEIFDSNLKNPSDFRNQILKKTADRYGIQLEVFEERLAQAAIEEPSKGIDSSIFSFGQSENSEDPLVRNTLIKVSAKEMRGKNGYSPYGSAHILVDKRHDISKDCEISDGPISFEELPVWAQKSLLNMELQEDYLAVISVHSCLLVTSLYLKNQVEEKSLERGELKPIAPHLEQIKDAKNVFEENLREYKLEESVWVKIVDLASQDRFSPVILDYSLIRYSALRYREGRNLLVFAYIPKDEVQARNADDLDLAIFCPEARALLGQLEGRHIQELTELPSHDESQSSERLPEIGLLTPEGLYRLDLTRHPKLLPLQVAP